MPNSMLTPLMRPQSASLRFIAVRMQIAELPQVVKQPGIGEGFRVTVQYHDARHPNQIATVTKIQGSDAQLTVVYRRADDRLLLFEYPLTAMQFQGLTGALRQIKFDTLDDALTPSYGADIWLLERAAGSFYHDLLLAPAHAQGIYAELTQVINTYIPLGLRLINV